MAQDAHISSSQLMRIQFLGTSVNKSADAASGRSTIGVSRGRGKVPSRAIPVGAGRGEYHLQGRSGWFTSRISVGTLMIFTDQAHI
jgi:hypothetical protein